MIPRSDVHSHLLPALDDGSRSVTETRGILRELSHRGIRNLALTPHFYPHQQSAEAFLEQRAKSYEAFSSLPEAERFRISLGAEVYFTRPLMNLEDLTPFCYQGTRLLLVELETGATSLSKSVISRLDRLVIEYEVIPVLAHVDRYPYLVRDPAALAALRDQGCLVQVNLEALYPFFFRHRIARLFRMGLVDFLGEDVHRTPPPREKRERALNFLEHKAPGELAKVEKNALSRIFS